MDNIDKILKTKIEKLEAKTDILIKIKEEINNRISFLNERVGELRSSLVEKEKDFTELKVSIEKALKIIEELKPEEILKKFNEFNAKIEVINAKIESNEAILSKIINELKDIRRVYLKFKSLEEIEKIENETRKNLGEIKKSESKILSTSTKIESIFSEINKRFEEFLEVKKDVLSLKEKYEEIIKDLNKLKVSSTSFIRKEELVEIEERLNKIKELEEELQNKAIGLQVSTDIKKFGELIKKFENDREVVFDKLKIVEEFLQKVKEVENKLDSIETRDFVKRVEFEKLKNDVLKYLAEIDRMKENINKKLEEFSFNKYQEKFVKVDDLEKKYEEVNENLTEIIKFLKTIAE